MAEVDQFRATLHHPAHRRLYDYWRSKAPPGRLPGRSDIDPVDIPDLLSSIALIDVEREGGATRFRYRLAGTEIVARAGRDPTGKTFEELYEGDYLQSANATYRAIVENGEPFLSGRSFPAAKDHVTYQRLILPLAADGRTVDMLIFQPVFLDAPSGGEA